MNRESLVAYWCSQDAPMRAALLAFWRNAATCQNVSSVLFTSVVATIQRSKHQHLFPDIAV